MPIREEVLRAARRLCHERGGWTFSPEEVVRAFYFRRVARGRYEILPR